jgi:hypothetical protein
MEIWSPPIPLIQATAARDWTIPFLSILHIGQRGGIHSHNKTTLESNFKLPANIIHKPHSMAVITYKPLSSFFLNIKNNKNNTPTHNGHMAHPHTERKHH